MSFKKLIVAGILCLGFLLSFPGAGNAQSINHVVQPGDSFWLISQKYGVPLKHLMAANNATEKTIIYPNQNITVPTDYGFIHTVKKGDTFWLISQNYGVSLSSLMKANNATEKTILYVGDKVYIPPKSQAQSSSPGTSASDSSSQNKSPYITYTWYTVKKGDILWDIAINFGIPFNELLTTNNLTENSVVYPGDVLKIPVHHVPVKETPGSKYGEYLDWWTEAQYVLPVGSTFEIVDFYTGKSFWAKRTTGANHADCETLTLNDTKIMKEIWGGNFSWNTRPIIIKYNGRKIAASASSMPHAGNDGAPGGVYTTWRSGNYGAGYNLDWVKGNGIDGVFDVHFLNSTRHNDGKIDSNHQANVKIAAGK